MIIPAGSPDLQEILQAEFRLERLRATRGLLQNVLIFDGVLVWMDAILPPLLHQAVGQLVLLEWPGCFVIFAAAGVLEYRTRKCLDRFLDAGQRIAE